MPVNASAPAERPIIAGRKQKPEQLFPVWSPAGVKEEHTRPNCNDLIRFHGYTDYDPAAHSAQSVNQVAEQMGVQLAKPVNPQLNALRSMALELGITVDPTWGLRKLKEMIDAQTRATQVREMRAMTGETKPAVEPKTAGAVPSTSKSV